jgi:hypothetical protein
MNKYKPIEKMSKRERKEYYAKQRGGWGDVVPITKRIPSGKLYQRTKHISLRDMEYVSRCSSYYSPPNCVYKTSSLFWLPPLETLRIY